MIPILKLRTQRFNHPFQKKTKATEGGVMPLKISLEIPTKTTFKEEGASSHTRTNTTQIDLNYRTIIRVTEILVIANFLTQLYLKSILKKDQRRPLGSYQSEMCSYAASGKECPNGESCQKSHNRVEEFYHPDKYKAKFCSSYIDDSGECEYGEYCSFAHSQAEISVELIDSFDKDSDFYMFHFKTVWCPYNETNHQRDLCVDGCSNEYNCLQSHGWKEQEYHPENYKLNPCKHGDQCNKIHCSYYHSEKDRRQPLQQWFKVFPKTRLVNFPSNYYMPFLRNLTYDRDFMGGIKQTSFSRTTTDISFQNNINQANSDSTKNSQKSLQLTPQSENQSKQPPQQTPPQITINTQAQQNFNLNAPQFVPNQNAPIQITQAQQNSQKRQSLVPNASNFLQLVNLQDIAAQKRMSTSPIIYQGPYNQQNLYQITDNYGQTSQFMMSSNISQTQPTNMSPDMISLSTINPQSSQNASEQFKKRYSMQPHPMNPMQFDHQNNKRYSAMYPNPILHPSILAAYNQEQQQIEEMKRLSLQTSTNQQLEMFLGHQYLNLPRGDEYMNYDYQSRVEPRSPDINIHKDIYKNINSEPKKKSLQIFEGLHQTMEKQEEQPGQESSSKSDPDEEDNDSDIDNIKYEEGDGSNPDDRAIDCSTIFSNIGLDLKQLDLSGNLSLAKLEGMCYEELRAMVVDEDKTMKLVNELNKLRRKRDEKWIQNLVDFHN
ncbi:zinc finger ccch type domain containing protein [Stylonychia lemnae]|uniref:Zinc finger ccch type domain containing protein n=1 Tax=Stylonychia lemnae TaxID=5949 RepID=A0A078B9W3_STYLE|nr:zinc finger ccch type domain containing protein [Stylonychia lemnae]|eukprot:CDW90057.1 zinc finger ccch type domain containing protein [Stylonychia lemnae]